MRRKVFYKQQDLRPQSYLCFQLFGGSKLFNPLWAELFHQPYKNKGDPMDPRYKF